MRKIDATRVASKLYVGSYPPAALKSKGFDVVVLCAKELQKVSPDIFTIRFPFDDGSLSSRDYMRAVRTATVVNRYRLAGKRVLVTCAMGINRSAFVAALAIMQLEHLPADTVIQRIRALRGPAVAVPPLSNPAFVEALKHFDKNG